MIEEYTRPLHVDERKALESLAADAPRPGQLLRQYAAIVAILLLVAIVMIGVLWGILATSWSDMMKGSLVILPGGLAILSLIVLFLILVNMPRVYREAREAYGQAMAMQPKRQALLELNEVAVTRIQVVTATEIVVDEDDYLIYLFGLEGGGTYFYESDLTEVGAWPSDCFERVTGAVDGEVVWERTLATGAELAPSLIIEEPWCYDGFERFIHREAEDEGIAPGVYNESPDTLLERLLGKNTVEKTTKD